MNIPRLTRLIDILKAVPPAQFDINTFGRKEACGTVACAIGHAALDPELMAQDLRVEYDGDYTYITFGERESRDAIMAFFDLTRQQAGIFYSPNYSDRGTAGVTAQDVIWEIEHLIRSAQ